MFERLLQALNSGGVFSVTGLARQLSVSEELVAVMAADLARRGYLVAPAACAGACAGCGVTEACDTSSRLWMLTDKGRRAAEMAQSRLAVA